MLRAGKYKRMCGAGFKPIVPTEVKEEKKAEKKAEVKTTQEVRSAQQKLFAAWNKF